MCAWIKVDQSLFTHIKISTLADHLDIDDMQAVGHITALWAWAIDNAPDGRLIGTDRIIAKAAHWHGNPARFTEGLYVSGFMDDDFDGKRDLHDWDEWAGALVRKRKADRDRMQEARRQQAEKQEERR